MAAKRAHGQVAWGGWQLGAWHSCLLSVPVTALCGLTLQASRPRPSSCGKRGLKVLPGYFVL